ncbi:MAG TPA: hypothetical protein VNM48_03755 [Chloroflexota bacterium]|nr:hypothetical protein [Chloroflexota bacterium]
MASIYQFGLVLSAVVLGICLASAWWQIRAARREAKAYERGRVRGLLETETVHARQLDTEYRRGYVAAQHDASFERRLARVTWASN